jgi:hypothetical protein
LRDGGNHEGNYPGWKIWDTPLWLLVMQGYAEREKRARRVVASGKNPLENLGLNANRKVTS